MYRFQVMISNLYNIEGFYSITGHSHQMATFLHTKINFSLLHNEYEIIGIFYITTACFSFTMSHLYITVHSIRKRRTIVITLALSNLLLSILYI